MRELEKILEEIEQRKARAEKLIVKPPHDKLDQVANDTAEAFIEAYKECQDIIRNLSREKSPEITRCSRDNDGWIPVGERLPEGKVNPVSQDFYEYQVTAKFEGLKDVRHYKYGNGHWWNGPGIVDDYVIAWKENPKPYRPERSEK